MSGKVTCTRCGGVLGDCSLCSTDFKGGDKIICAQEHDERHYCIDCTGGEMYEKGVPARAKIPLSLKNIPSMLENSFNRIINYELNSVSLLAILFTSILAFVTLFNWNTLSEKLGLKKVK